MLKLSHKKLTVWEYSIDLVTEIYKLTGSYPAIERYGLISQMRRASVSIVSNLSEGASRKSKTEKSRFYEIARSSLVELDAQIEVSIQLGYIQNPNFRVLSDKMNSTFSLLTGLINSCN